MDKYEIFQITSDKQWYPQNYRKAQLLNASKASDISEDDELASDISDSSMPPLVYGNKDSSSESETEINPKWDYVHNLPCLERMDVPPLKSREDTDTSDSEDSHPNYRPRINQFDKKNIDN